MKGARNEQRRLELTLTGLQTSNENLRKEVEKLQIGIHSERQMMKAWKREKAAELRAAKENEAAKWSKLLKESKAKMDTDYQRQLQAQRDIFDRDMAAQVLRIRAGHNAELRDITAEFSKTEEFLQVQIKEIKEKLTQTQKDNGSERHLNNAERDKYLTEIRILKEEKRHLDELLQTMTEADKRKAAERRQLVEEHQKDINRLNRVTKQEGLQLLQTLKAKDKEIEQLKDEVGRLSRKRKWPSQLDNRVGEGGGMAPSAKRGYKKTMTKKKDNSVQVIELEEQGSLQHELKEHKHRIHQLEDLLKEKTELLDSIRTGPFAYDSTKTLLSEDEFSSLTSQDSGITSVPGTPTNPPTQTSLCPTPEAFSRILKEHQDLQRNHQLLRQWVIENSTQEESNQLQPLQSLLPEQQVQVQEEQQPESIDEGIKLVQSQEDAVITDINEAAETPQGTTEPESEKTEQMMTYEEESAPKEMEDRVQMSPLIKINELQHLLDLSQKELHELREQNELLEFRVLELETRQQTLVASMHPSEEFRLAMAKGIREVGEDTSDLWENTVIETDHMSQLDIFLHSDADPSEKADAVQEWMEEALSEAWITPVCQHSLVRVTNVLRMMQNRLAQAESEMIQGPKFCGSLETILEEKEEAAKDSMWTQTEEDDDDVIRKLYLSEKLVRQLEDELSEARHQLLSLSHENATLHEQLSNIHEQRTTVSATESELGHLEPPGSDLSDHEVDHEHRLPPINFNYSEGPYDSIDSVPDKVRMEGTYLNMKTDMVIHDFQESGIFEGDEDIKLLSENNSEWSPGRREEKESMRRMNTIEEMNDDRQYYNTKDTVLIRRMSADSGTECERKLSAELDAKIRELDKVYGDVRQLDHCMDCLRLQLDGGTPCYPLGQGFTDILDKVRKIQEQNNVLLSKNQKYAVEMDLLRESQSEMAKELEQMRRVKREMEEAYQHMREAEEVARTEASRLSARLNTLTREEEILTEAQLNKRKHAIVQLQVELEESKNQLKVAMSAITLLTLWEHFKRKGTVKPPACYRHSDTSTSTSLVPVNYSQDYYGNLVSDGGFVRKNVDPLSSLTINFRCDPKVDATNSVNRHDKECQVDVASVDEEMRLHSGQGHSDLEEYYASQIQFLEKEKLEFRKEMEAQREDYLSQLNLMKEASELNCRNAEKADKEKNMFQRRFFEIEEELQGHKKNFETLVETTKSDKEIHYREKCQLHQEYQMMIDNLHEEICDQKHRSSELENTLNAFRQELEIVSVVGDEIDVSTDYSSLITYGSLEKNSQCKNDDVIRRIRELMQSESTLRQKVYELEKKEAAYRETLQEADKIMSSVEARYCDRIQEMETREGQLKQQMHHNEQNETRLRHALRAATKGGEMFKVPDLLEKLIETESSELKLREQVHRLEQEENAMRMKYTEAEKMAAELKEELRDQEEMVSQMSQVQRDNTNLESENDTLRSHMRQVGELEETLRFYKSRLEELEESENSLKKRLEQLSFLHDTSQKKLQQEVNACKEEVDRTTAVLHGSRKTNEALNKDLAELRERIAEAEEEMKQKREEADMFEASNRHEICKLRQQLGLANEQLSDIESLNCKLREQLSDADKTICELTSELSELRHVHEKSLLQLNLQLMQKDDELQKREEQQLQLDGRELDALCNRESELKSVERRLTTVGEDLQKCCECGLVVAPVLDNVIEDLRLLLTLICGEVASQEAFSSNTKNIDELESSCEDLSIEMLEDEPTPLSIDEDDSPRFLMEKSKGELQRVASLEETLRRWEKEGDLLQAQLEDRENQIKKQVEEISRQQSVIEQLRERTVELYHKFEQQRNHFTSTAEELQCKCDEKNTMLAMLAREVGETTSNVEELIKRLDSISKGKQECVQDYTVELLKDVLRKHTIKKQQQSSGMRRRKSLCDLLAHVKWDNVRASSETCLLPPGSAPSKIPRYVPLQVKQVEPEKPPKNVNNKEKKKRVSLSALHRSKVTFDLPESREESPVKPDYRERSPLESLSGLTSGHGPQLQPPQDFRITRKVGEDSLILAWTPLKDDKVAGYQILVNGVVAQHVRSPQRNKALLPALPLHRGLHLAIRALSVPKGNRAPAVGLPYAIRYDPRIQYNLSSDCHSGSVHLLRHATPQLVFETEC